MLFRRKKKDRVAPDGYVDPDATLPYGYVPPPPPPAEPEPERRRGRRIRRVAILALKVLAAYYVFCVLLLVIYRFVQPPTTGVQAQRRLEAMIGGGEYAKRREIVSSEEMSRHVARAVVAAEDGRFWTHRGFDWIEMENARKDAIERGRMRGASTITQQLMKNLFGCACRNPIRKLYDYALTPPAELILGKNRILELYLNNVEWGDGVFGIEAAAEHHYDTSAAKLTRTQSAGLAALLPNPRRRTPENTGWYRREILRRMGRRGW
ncbi:MAG TPA: monofunctional biosynthetic peptidoglycan transglycosylase [Longimicrobium sp.]|nr:monofunctional biosynthetic peptidoglycan transglycosylase [Longimicrobium sp.]